MSLQDSDPVDSPEIDLSSALMGRKSRDYSGDEDVNVTFTDPTDFMTTAQDMLKALKKNEMLSEDSAVAVQEIDLSPEEIEVMRAEQQAMMEDMIVKMQTIQANSMNREAQEISSEALDNWDSDLS